jgi:amidohydrolase
MSGADFRLGREALTALVSLRRDIHRHPELGFKEHRTADRVAEVLAELDIPVARAIGGTGVVATLVAGSGQRAIGLRADMDALAMSEASGRPYSSQSSGVFHGCGHDGHTAILIGAAQALAASRDFDGTVHFIFQPAEEGLAGARAMIEDGLFERFPCERVFALHNWPTLPLGTISTRAGAIMAAADRFTITLEGAGGHAAFPDSAVDVVLAAAQLIQSLHTIICREIPSSDQAVLTVTQMKGGQSHNVIPASATIGGTVRSFDPTVQDRIEASVRRHAESAARANRASAQIVYDRYYPATINDPESAAIALRVGAVCGTAIEALNPSLTSEDFGFMLQHRPGAYIWLGQGDERHAAALHQPSYDFNDALIEPGVRLMVGLVQACLPHGI